MSTACIVVAGGNGARLGAERPKALVTVGDRTIVEHALVRVLDSGVIDHVVVVAPKDHEATLAASLTAIWEATPRPDPPDPVIMGSRHPATPNPVIMGSRHPEPPNPVIMGSRHPEPPNPVIMDSRHPSLRVVAGGSSRQSSVRRGLQVLTDDADVVLVHDAARCLTPPGLIRAVVDAVRAGHPAVVPAVPVTDTIRSVDGGVVDRTGLRAVQTPQGFARDVLVRAHDDAAQDADDESQAATDDAGLVERCGVPVHLVAGDPMAFKVTTALDLLLARSVLSIGVTGGFS